MQLLLNEPNALAVVRAQGPEGLGGVLNTAQPFSSAAMAKASPFSRNCAVSTWPRQLLPPTTYAWVAGYFTGRQVAKIAASSTTMAATMAHFQCFSVFSW